MLSVVVHHYDTHALREILELLEKAFPTFLAHCQALHLGLSFELEVEPFGEHHVECAYYCSGAELEAVPYHFVDFVSYVVHSLLNEVEFGWFVQLTE